MSAGDVSLTFKLIWSILIGLAMILTTIAGAWVGSAERRLTTIELKHVELETKLDGLLREERKRWTR